MTSLKNKVCFITGGSQGIGKATALSLLEGGARVFIMARSKEKIDRFLQEKTGRNLGGCPGDVGQEADVQAAFSACRSMFGEVDILVNNAGTGIPTPDLAETDLDTYEKMMNANMRGVFLCSREALKSMKEKGQGHILTVVSMAGHRTNPTAPLYCASKFGARGISSGLADQVLKLGIKVTEVNPGPVDSAYWGDRQVPRGKFLKPEDVARVIRFVLEQPEDVLVREVNFDNMKYLAG